MKKQIVYIISAILIVFSFFFGQFTVERKLSKDNEQRFNTLTYFAIEKLEDIKVKESDEELDTLLSNIYAAKEFCQDENLYSAYHELWNALLFDGDKLKGNEEELIEALKAKDAERIEGIALKMRK